MNIEALSCQCCGAPLKPGNSVCTCEYCGQTNIVSGETGKYIDLLNRANELRQQCEFDRAFRIYEDILDRNPPFVDILWAMTLCEYGIEYVQDPASTRYIPTLHRINDESILNSESFNEAVEMADDIQKEELKAAASQIARIQEDYLNIAKNEKPYDVFICYKETDDETGLRTEDSEIGERLYRLLTGMGLKVFFSRETLQDKLGVNYEPYIFAALKSSPAMVVLGTRTDYFHAVWVRNEWSRFIKLRELDDQKLIMFACKDINDLPAAFRRMQAQLLTGDEALVNIAENIRDHLTGIRGENTELVRIKCPECLKAVSVDPSDKASICPHCRKPFIVLEAIAKFVPGGNRIKCPHCGKEQERNKYGCIFCHKRID